MQIVQEFMQRLNSNKCKIEEKEKKFKLYLIPEQYIWVVLMVTHGETARCFTKSRKVSRINQFPLLCIKDRKR